MESYTLPFLVNQLDSEVNRNSLTSFSGFQTQGLGNLFSKKAMQDLMCVEKLHEQIPSISIQHKAQLLKLLN